MQVVASPCWTVVLPDVISVSPSVDAWAPIAAARWVHVPITFPSDIGLPPMVTRSAPATPAQRLQSGEFFSRLQPFTNVQASTLACHPGRSYRSGYSEPPGSRGIFVRAEHALLPPRASDVLAV